MLLLRARAVGARARSRRRDARTPLHPRLFSAAPANLTLAEPPPPPAPPPRKNWDLDGDTLNVWVEADFFAEEGRRTASARAAGGVFGEPLDGISCRDCVKWQRNNRRQIHRASKRRGDVRGSTRKLYKQKGTGAGARGERAGTYSEGGGKAHGPTRRDFATSFNRRQRKMALRVSSRRAAGRPTDRRALIGRRAAHAEWSRRIAEAGHGIGVVRRRRHRGGLRRAVANARVADALPQIGANARHILRRDRLVLSESAAFSLAGRLVGR